MQTLDAFDRRFPTEESCRQYLKGMRWPDGVRCPRCGNDKVYALKARPFNWLCKSGEESVDPEGNKVVCDKKNGYRFSVLTYTIFENTKRPLKAWFKIGYLMLVSKKGISALQLHRMMYGSKHLNNYHTTWYMCHRLRAAMYDDEWTQLMGEVEIDETYVGGKEKNRHRSQRKQAAGDGAQRQGSRHRCHLAQRQRDLPSDREHRHADARRIVRKAVNRERVDLVATDENYGYRLLSEGGDAFAFPHQVIRHSAGEYVRGVVHTNSIESFWSLLKRGIVGTFHKVSKDHLPLYLSEFTFRHSRRNDDDPFAELISNA